LETLRMLNQSHARWSPLVWCPLVWAVALGVMSCRHPEPPKPPLELKTDDDKAFYGLGLDIGRNIAVFALQPAELELVKLGLSDAVTKRAPKVDLDKVRPQLMDLARKRSQATSDAEKLKGKAGVEKAAKE